MTAEEFLNKLAAADLAPPEIVESLRRQVAAAKEPIAANAVAKLLVEKGHLTVNQAQRMLGNAATTSAINKAAPPAGVTAASAIQKKAATSGVQKPATPAANQPTPSQVKKVESGLAPAQNSAPAASLSSSSIHSDIGLASLDDHALGSAASSSPSALASTSSIHSGIHVPSPATSAALSGSHVLDDVGLAPLDGSSASSASAKTSAKSTAKAASTSSVNLDDGLGLVPDDGLSHKGPPPGSLAAKILEQKAAEAKQNAAESGSVIKPVASTVTTPPKPKPTVTVTPVALEDLPPLDDLSSPDLAPLDDLASLEELAVPAQPIATPAALAPQPAPLGGIDPLGGSLDPLSGSLDPLGGPTDLGALAAQTAAPLGQPTPAALSAAAAANESRTTMIVGLSMGGAALLVILVGLAIYFWPRGSGQAEFAAAEQAYQEKQYGAAIEKYDALLKLFPNHEQASLVRVHHAMCRIQEANPGSGDWSGVLPRLREALAPVAAEPALAQVHAELAPLLIQQCESLTESAAKLRPGDELKTRLSEAQAALTLCNDARLVPDAMRPWQKLALLEERLELLSREQAASAAREQAQATLAQHASAGKVTEFLAERAKLIAAYPETAAAEQWRELGMSLAESAPKNIKSTAEKKAAAKEAPALPYGKSVPWQTLSGVAPAENTSSRVEVVCVGGAAYGIDYERGRVIWIHYAGSLPGDGPAISSDGNLVWLMDRGRQALISLSAKSGAIAWSQALASPAVGKPLLAGSKLLLALEDGSVQAFDAQSGELQASVKLPQSLSAGPSLSADGKQLIQVADEALVYVLNAETLQVERASYVGHGRGTIAQPALALGAHAIVAARQGEQTALAAVPLSGDKSDLPRVTIDGVIGSSLVLIGKRVLLPADNGRIHVLEATGDDASPLRVASALDPPAGQPFVRHLAIAGNGICATGQGCSLLRFDSQGKLETAWSALGGDAGDSAATALGDAIITAHVNAGQGIAWVTALKASDGLAIWHTPLRAPLQLIGEDQSGDPPLAIPLNFVGSPPESISLASVRSAANHQFVPLGPKRFTTAERGRPELLVWDAANANNLQSTTVALAGSTLAGVPALVGQELLVPLADGSVQCFDPATGKPTAAPFVLPGSGARGWPPVVMTLGDKSDSALVFDGDRSLVKIARAAQPQPHWAEQAAARTQERLVAPPAIVGDVVLAVDGNGLIHTFALADLAAGPTHDLRGSGAIWGPHTCGQCALLATDADELICVDSASAPRWQQKLGHGGLVGLPLVRQESVVTIGRSGVVEVRSLSSGDVLGSVDLQQPLAGSAHLAGNTLWVATTAGQVLQVTLPASSAAKEKP